jgi:hypothetical protein
MLIDLHNHTRVSSPCSQLSPQELIEAARRNGLDGICVTDHLCAEGANVARELGRRMNFPVFRGIEARSALGDMLVYGYYKDIPEGISLEDLCWYVHEVGGAVFVAHPFHTKGGWNLYASMRARGMEPLGNWRDMPVLGEVDGIETENGQVRREVNEKARRLAERARKPGIGGSDAHSVDMVGKAATEFPRPIRSDEELVAALKSGEYRPVRLRY